MPIGGIETRCLEEVHEPEKPLMFLLTLGWASFLPADTVTLNDGTKIIGTATGNARQIVIKTPGGDRTVSPDQVQSIRRVTRRQSRHQP